jgi:hypothetical protein
VRVLRASALVRGRLTSLVRHANNYEVWCHMRDQFPHPYTREAADEWIALVGQRNPQTYFTVEVVRGARPGCEAPLVACRAAAHQLAHLVETVPVQLVPHGRPPESPNE